jgi:homoserine kinase
MTDSELIEEYRAQVFATFDVIECRERMIKSLIINDSLDIDQVAYIGETYGLFSSDSAIVAADMLLNRFDALDIIEAS